MKFVPFSESYLKELAVIHRISHKDHFNSKLGNAYAEKLINWFADETEYQGILLVAVDENTNALVGYICGARDGFVEKQNKDLLPTIITSFLTRPYLVFTKKFIDLAGIKLRSFIGKDDDLEFEAYERTLPSPIFSVNVFALSPEYRDKGFGIFLLDTLMNEFFSAAKAKGAKTVSGTIWTENKPIYSYYKLRKWIQAPGNPQDKRTRFYKIL